MLLEDSCFTVLCWFLLWTSQGKPCGGLLNLLAIQVTTVHWLEFPVLYIMFSFVIYLMYSINRVYVSVPISQFLSPPSPLLVSIHLFSASVSLFLLWKWHLYHFSRFHIYVLIYSTCFSLSDLLHSVWHTLGPSVSLQMTQFHSFLWLSNIPLCICTTASLSLPLLMDS